MRLPAAIRNAAILAVALIVGGCSTTPSVSPMPSASASPTTSASPGTPSSTPGSEPARLSRIFLHLLESTPSGDIEYGPLLATSDRFVVTGMVGEDMPVMWYGDATGTTWELYDASGLRGRIVDLAVGPAGSIAATRDEAGLVRLWTSRDGQHWERYPEPGGIEEATDIHVWVTGQSFGVNASRSGTGDVIYTSNDGKRWAAPGATLVLPGEGSVVELDGRYLFASSGRPIEYSLSADGRTWAPIAVSGTTVPRFIRDLHAAGEGVIAIGEARRGTTISWYGTLSGAGQDATITWAETTPDGGFGPFDFAATALTDPFGVLLGSDPSSHTPIAWSTSGSARWTRRELPASAFGHGVPGRMAVVGTTAVALGWRVNRAGEWVLRPWRSTDGGSWSAVDTDVFGDLPRVPTGPCPPVALDEVSSYLAIPAVLRPICFGHRTLHIRGYAVDCGGCGGAAPGFNGHPGWLQNPLDFWPLYLQPSPRSRGVWPERLGIAINPAHPVRVPPVGAFVDLEGHFDDAAAARCTDYPLPGFSAGYEPQSIVVAGCRQRFVATRVTILAR